MTLREELEPLNENTLTFIASHLLEEIEEREGTKPLGTPPEEQFRSEYSYLQDVTGTGGEVGKKILGKKQAAIELLTTFSEASPEFDASLRQAIAERDKAGKQLFDPVTGLSFILVAIAVAIIRPNFEYEHDRTKKGEHKKISFKFEGAKQLDKVIAAVGKLIPSILPFVPGAAGNADSGDVKPQ
jgi:hypothetical protein